MEIGKRGIWSHEQMYAERPDVMYEKIAADTMMDLEEWRRAFGRAPSRVWVWVALTQWGG